MHNVGNPGRPVISSINCHKSNISECVGDHHKPIVQQISSYVQYTNDFLRKFNKIKKKNSR